jgi:hypothetical protein
MWLEMIAMDQASIKQPVGLSWSLMDVIIPKITNAEVQKRLMSARKRCGEKI